MALVLEDQRPLDGQETSDSTKQELETRAVRATSYMVAFYAIALSLRIVSSVVLSRLFSPEYFGLLSLLSTVIIGLNLFTHIGLEDSVIQNARGDEPSFLNTAWTLQVIRGIGLWLVFIPLAWPVAHFYHEPRMILLLPVLGFGCVISGFYSPSLFVLARHMGVGRLSTFELLGQLALFLGTVAWALVDRSIWALVFGRFLSDVVRLITSYCIGPRLKPRFCWEKKAVNQLIRFGRWIMLSTALTFLSMQSDRLILGKLAPLQMVGIYGVAYSLSDLPRQIITMFCTRVGYPFIAKFSDKPRQEYRAAIIKYRFPVLLAGMLLITLVVCTGDQFILHVYDKRYHQAAWMIGILAIGLWHTLLYSTISPAIFSLQKSHYNALAYSVYCVSLFVLLPFGYHAMGMLGAVIAVAASDLPAYFVIGFSAQREAVAVWRQDLICTGIFAAVLLGAITFRNQIGYPISFPPFHWAALLHFNFLFK